MTTAQVLTAAQMRAAEQALFDAGTSVSDLMEIAAGGAAEWIRRIAAGRAVTVLCGPGNNGGDGYVIARLLRSAGNAVTVVAPIDPATDAARAARRCWDGPVATTGGGGQGDVFVDCLFGSGLSRALIPEHALILRDLARRHRFKVAVDVPSGIASGTGAVLNDRLPAYDLTLALGAWKFAHWSLPGRALMGQLRCVPIGIAPVEGAAQLVARPRLAAPPADAHKYTRGLCAIVAGTMPGASILAGLAAQKAGAGYVKLLGGRDLLAAPPSLPVWTAEPVDALKDKRLGSVLVGQGLGNTHSGRELLEVILAMDLPMVIDADGLRLLEQTEYARTAPTLVTPHDGEMEALCRAFRVIADGRRNKAIALAKASGMVVCAKGPDTVIAAPDGRVALGTPAPSWLSVAGSGDVLAGIAASRMATGADPFTAACEAVWLHGAAARLCGPAFTPEELALAVGEALAVCL